MATPRPLRFGMFGALVLTWAALQPASANAAEPANPLDLKLPSVFLKPAPEGVDDLKAIQTTAAKSAAKPLAATPGWITA
jgi:hypothetical protein